MGRLLFSHIVNPVPADPSTHLGMVQPVTFESMRRAASFARDSNIDVDLYSTGYDAEGELAGEGFTVTRALDRSLLDFIKPQRPRPLPLLHDIIDRLYETSRDDVDQHYLVYTNVDIGLMPNFYAALPQLLGQAAKSLVINRRTIAAEPFDPAALPLIYAQVGEPHPGFDCFVFPRTAWPNFHLEHVVIGIPLVGQTLLANLENACAPVELLKESHLTFHLGDDQTWRNPDFEDCRRFNAEQAQAGIEKVLQHPGAPQQAPFSQATLAEVRKILDPRKPSRRGTRLERWKKKLQRGD